MILHDDFKISYLCELCELSLRSQWFKISLTPLAVFRVRTEPESAQSWKAMGCGSKRATLGAPFTTRQPTLCNCVLVGVGRPFGKRRGSYSMGWEWS